MNLSATTSNGGGGDDGGGIIDGDNDDVVGGDSDRGDINSGGNGGCSDIGGSCGDGDRGGSGGGGDNNDESDTNAGGDGNVYDDGDSIRGIDYPSCSLNPSQSKGTFDGFGSKKLNPMYFEDDLNNLLYFLIHLIPNEIHAMVESRFWTLVDMASRCYLWRNLVSNSSKRS
ncbi:hypothetical protein JHK85_048063 [Glycine max]|nr:hypothetical protein JHK85_048063 [Glycine max]